ncbi:MAG: hypothetical protein AB1813_19375, partial [Verrucomicrobiota bacterium]
KQMNVDPMNTLSQSRTSNVREGRLIPSPKSCCVAGGPALATPRAVLKACHATPLDPIETRDRSSSTGRVDRNFARAGFVGNYASIELRRGRVWEQIALAIFVLCSGAALVWGFKATQALVTSGFLTR